VRSQDFLPSIASHENSCGIIVPPFEKAHLAWDGQQASLSGSSPLGCIPAKLILFHANLRVWEQYKLRSNNGSYFHESPA
jgi:hypothetical protein